MNEIITEHPWFRSVLFSYKRKTGSELLYGDFAAMNNLELAQTVMNSASCGGLRDFDNILLGGMYNAEEEADDE